MADMLAQSYISADVFAHSLRYRTGAADRNRIGVLAVGGWRTEQNTGYGRKQAHRHWTSVLSKRTSCSSARPSHADRCLSPITSAWGVTAGGTAAPRMARAIRRRREHRGQLKAGPHASP